MLFRHYGSYLAEYDGQTAKSANPDPKSNRKKKKAFIVQLVKLHSPGSNPQLPNNVPEKEQKKTKTRRNQRLAGFCCPH